MNLSPAPLLTLPEHAGQAAEAFWLRADDDVRLRVALWRARNGTGAGDRTPLRAVAEAHGQDPAGVGSGPMAAKGTVLLFPGRTEYAEKYAPVCPRLTAAGYHVLAPDWRGQGMSDRLQDDPRPGHVADFAHYQLDAVAVVEAAVALDLPEPWHLLAHSMGGAIGLAALVNGLPVVTATFSAPMWGINHGSMPRAVALGLAGVASRLGRGGLPALGTGGGGTYVLDEPFRDNLLTGNAEAWARLVCEAAAWPELTLGGASYDWVGHALRECLRLGTMSPPDLPVLVSLGTQERIVSPRAIRERVAHWPQAQLLEIEGARHEVMFETPERRDRFFDAFLSLLGSHEDGRGIAPGRSVEDYADTAEADAAARIEEADLAARSGA